MFWLDCAGDPGEAVVPKNILFIDSEPRIIVRDFGSLVYYGVAKISLSWVWHLGGGGRGALGYFLGGYVLPRTPNWHPVLEKISPKIDTPF